MRTIEHKWLTETEVQCLRDAAEEIKILDCTKPRIRTDGSVKELVMDMNEYMRNDYTPGDMIMTDETGETLKQYFMVDVQLGSEMTSGYFTKLPG